MRIFYSWQSDTPTRIGKDFIRKALEDAIERIEVAPTLENADRNEEGIGIELDQDTQGVLGSPPITQIIFNKIANADLVVVDVTLTGHVSENKKAINSNVAIELGYALGARGFDIVLKIMNTSYGTPSELPFDLRGRRWPIQYAAPNGVERKELRRIRNTLSKRIEDILNEYLKHMPDKGTVTHEKIEHTTDVGRYWEPNEALVGANLTYGRPALTCNADSLFFLRLVPQSALPALSSAECAKIISEIEIRPLAHRASGSDRERNRYGSISFTGNYESGNITSATQLFKNREIWGFDSWILSHTTTNNAHQEVRFIGSETLKEMLLQKMPEYFRYARELGYADGFKIEAGMTQTDGLYIAVHPEYVDRFWGPIYEVQLQVSFNVDGDTNPHDISNKIIRAIFQEAGAEPPDRYLIG